MNRRRRVSHEPHVPTRRIVLLGASNVTIGISSAVATACHAWGNPLDIMAAIGHGRSYGKTTRVLGRKLPGIVSCGLWDELARRPRLPTAALMTDIGNDLIYGSDLGPICRWLETCAQRLSEHCERLVISRLPLESVAEMQPWKMWLLKTAFFPSSHLDHGQAVQKAKELDQWLIQLSKQLGAETVRPERIWYGWDPIHVSRRYQAAAWRKFFTPWTVDGQPPDEAARSMCRWLMLQRARPMQWSQFGFQRSRQQPTIRLNGGSRISLY